MEVNLSDHTTQQTVTLNKGFHVAGVDIYPMENNVCVGNSPRRLSSKPMAVLLFLATNINQVVSREQIIVAVWKHQFIADITLTRAISDLRKIFALGSSQETIETIPKKGYRLKGCLSQLNENGLRDNAMLKMDVISAASSSFSKFKRKFVGAAVLILMASVFWYLYANKNTKENNTENNPTKIIAVLPFLDLSEEENMVYFSAGIAEEIRSQLSRNPQIRVISRSSLENFDPKQTPLQELAKQVNADLFVEGSVRRAKNKIRISTKLINAKDQTQVWSGSFERNLVNIFQIQHHVARTVAKASGNELVQQFESPQKNAIQAYDYFLLAKYHLKQLNQESIKQAINYLELSLQQAPAYIPALALLSDAIIYSHIYAGEALSEEQEQRQASVLAQALLTSPKSPEVITAQGLSLYLDGDNQKAVETYHKAIEQNDSHLEAYNRLGRLYSQMKRWQDAAETYQSAIILNPLSSELRNALGNALQETNETDLALIQYKKAIELSPESAQGYSSLAEQQKQLGLYDEAITTYQTGLQHIPDDPSLQIHLARLFLDLDLMNEADTLIALAEKSAPNSTSVHYVKFLYHLKNQAYYELANLVDEIRISYPQNKTFQLREAYVHWLTGNDQAALDIYQGLDLGDQRDLRLLFNEFDAVYFGTYHGLVLMDIYRAIGDKKNLSKLKLIAETKNVNGAPLLQMFLQTQLALLSGEQDSAHELQDQLQSKNWQRAWIYSHSPGFKKSAVDTVRVDE